MKSCAAVCGLGTDNCVMVPSDERGRMILPELERLIQERKNRGQVFNIYSNALKLAFKSLFYIIAFPYFRFHSS